MIRRILAGLSVTAITAVGMLFGGANPAYADAIVTTAYYTDMLDHLGNPAYGQVKFEAWIAQYQTAQGNVTGTVGVTRMTDIQGGVVAISVNRQAVKWGGNQISIQRNDTQVVKQTPGTQVQLRSDSNDSIGDFYWANTDGHSIGGNIEYDSNVSVRWADGSLGTYSLGSQLSWFYTCPDGSQTNCGSQSLPFSI